jgi:hypothetical protein
MNRLLAALCCLLLASSHLALAQDKGTAKKAPPTKKEMADKKKAVNMQAAMCVNKSRRDKLKQGSKEFHSFMSQCLNEKK